MNKRIFVEKRPIFLCCQRVWWESSSTTSDRHFESIRIVQVYIVFDFTEDLFAPGRKTHLLWAGDRPCFGQLDSRWILPTMFLLPLKTCQGSLTSVQLLFTALLGSSSDVTVNTAQFLLGQYDIDATELEAVVRTICSTQLILVSRTSMTGIAKQEFFRVV